MDHKEHIDEIAQAAALLHGQDWRSLPGWTKDRWKETVRHMNRAATGVNDMEAHAGQAIDEWYKKKEVKPEATLADVEPVFQASSKVMLDEFFSTPARRQESAEVPPKKKPKSK